MSSPRVRYPLRHLQTLYETGKDRSQLENLIRAFRGIQDLPPENENSFFHIAGFHGLPFRGKGQTDAHWWGGYCWHETILFPTWHRAYLIRLEDALRSIKGCQDVTLPFWDQTVILGKPNDPRIPAVLTAPHFELDGRSDNPLYSYKLQKALVYDVDEENHRYSKDKGYTTLRYPFSGLFGTDEDKKKSLEHNDKFVDPAKNTEILNNNVTEWLLGTVKIPDDDKHTGRPDTYSIRARYWRCLLAPDYTVFSNTASQQQYIKDHGQDPKRSHYVVSLESPHNAIHLAVGGFYQEGKYNADPIRGANGDMGDNETAGFDPIFYFHHCFIDYVFSVWQQLHHQTTRLTIKEDTKYPGTFLKIGQPPHFKPGTHLDTTTPLYPFTKRDGKHYNSDDVTDLNNLPDGLKIAYRDGSLDRLIPVGVGIESGKTPFNIIKSQLPVDPVILADNDPKAKNLFSAIKRVHNINRAKYEGSFVVRLFAQGHDGKEVEVGREPILSRWNIDGCLNCQNHLDVKFYVPIDKPTLESLEGPEKTSIAWRVGIQTRDGNSQSYPMFPSEGDEADTDSPQVDDL